MATKLDIINDCLATMGEAPLNTLTEPHAFKQPALARLSRTLKQLQATGWWFNLEAATFEPDPINGFIQLPGDVLKWQSGVKSNDLLVPSEPKPWLIQRGTRLYDNRNRTYVLTESVTGELVREIPLEDLPQVFNDYVAAVTVLKFQSDFDSDNGKRQELSENVRMTRMQVNAENTRQLKVNLLNNNPRLARLKRVTRRYV